MAIWFRENMNPDFKEVKKWCDILDESQWIITPNAHEPIISRELFDKAQVRLKAAQQKAAKKYGRMGRG